jgi:hypothetical protein
VEKPRNDLGTSLVRYCLALEEHRRTPEGRVRTPQQFLQSFFPYDEKGPDDQVFVHLPKEVRGPIISTWGIRGQKAALRDDDAKIATVVFDALVAGDLTPPQFEEGLSAATVVGWVPLAAWWTFWRAGTPHKAALLKALTTGYELGLFDAKWFWDTLETPTASDPATKKKGTEVVSAGLTKEDIIEWIKRVHVSGDGSPKGLLEAIGWDKIVAKTGNDALAALLDALALKLGLAKPPEEKPEPKPEAEAKPAGEEEVPKTDPPPPADNEISVEVSVESTTAEVIPAAAPSRPAVAATPAAKKSGKHVEPETDLAETGPYQAAATGGPTARKGAAQAKAAVSLADPDDEDGGDTMLYRDGKPINRK